ncbi:MAG: alpha/beta hydrolase [Alphaproteobacteria bacterium]|nr:alpha/beta hydrolase [Alphaproteobacteria bacterium]
MAPAETERTDASPPPGAPPEETVAGGEPVASGRDAAETEPAEETEAEETAAATAPEAITEEEIDLSSIEPGAGPPAAEGTPDAGATPESGGAPQTAPTRTRPTGGFQKRKTTRRYYRRSTKPATRGLSQPPAAANGSSGSSPPPTTTTAPLAPTAPPVLPAPEVAEIRQPDAPPALPPIVEPPKTAAAAAPKKEEDWSIVPVYYGTDRKRADKKKRIAYDWQRGRRLELGRALVTIPKNHEVPMVERPWALKIPYIDVTLYEAAEDPKLHFTLKELKALTKEEFLALIRERLAKSTRFKDHALVFVHGYKTRFDNAVYRTAQIAYDLKFDGAPFLYSWPSGGTLQGYTYDRESASSAEPYLRQFLEIISKETGAKKLSVIAHSMGNQLLLRVLQDFKRSLPEGVLISQLILAAPDVDRDSFEHIVSSIEGIAEGITLYAASNDTALQVSRRVNGGVPRAGDVPEAGPIVLKGVDTIDATATSMDSVGINHNGYAENNALLEDIGKLISQGTRPPEVRLPKLKRIETDKGPYWQYPAADAR